MTFPREEFYNRNISQARSEIKHLNRKIDRISLMRLALIVVGGVALFQVIQAQLLTLTLLGFVAVLVLFFIMVSKQSRLVMMREAAEHFLSINENEVAIQSRHSPNIYNNGDTFTDDGHPYASDLDIYGEGSLFQLVNRCATVGGEGMLASWFGSTQSRSEIVARQEMVAELAGDFSFWQRIQAQLHFALDSKVDFKRKLHDFLSTSLVLSKGRWLPAYVKVAPWIMLISMTGSFFYDASLGIFLILGITHFLLGLFYSPKIGKIGMHLSRAGDTLGSFANAFAEIERKEWTSGLAKQLLAQVQGSGMPVSLSIRELSKLLNRLDVRHNVFIGSFLNIVMLWDVRQVLAIEDWRNRSTSGIPLAFDLLSTLEAIGSLATFQFNRPSAVIPLIREEAGHILECRQIAHPFLPEEILVRNDYSLADHKLALITGSNMAGKSTFLRTVGINAVLAYAGAPVVATSMELSVMQLVTYMRIRDSLNESTSTFKAELDRITMVLKQVEERSDAFFLLDEMLRGTNSVDKYLGSKAIIEKLIAFEGVGMVATHDLKLAELSGAYPGYVKNFHFDIQVHKEQMLFDYLLKDGPCTIFNASLLLKKIGIHI